VLGTSVKVAGRFQIGSALALAFIATVLSVPSAAWAQEPPASSSAPSDDAADQSWAERQLDWAKRLLFSASTPTGTEPRRSDQKQAPVPTVTASRPVVREVTDWDEYTGRIEAVETVEVRARVSGYLEKVHFTDGQLVSEGDLLYTIDPRPFERVLETARAELHEARVKAENAAKDVERGRPLVEKGWLSQRQFDERDNLLREAQAAVAVAEARVKAAELDLSFTRITAPITGRTSRSELTAGNYVAVGGSENSPVLTTIVRQDPVYVYFDIGENKALKYLRLHQVGQGTAVRVGLPDETGYPHQARLDFTDNRLDTGTGTLRMRAVLDNKSGLFRPGMFARIQIAGSGSYSAIMIPDEAIGTDQVSKFVYVVEDDGTAIRKWIEPGPLIDGLRVVRSGLSADEWTIVKGIQRVRHQEKVAVRKEPLQVSAAPSKPVDQ
jgi:RND family efflux transporter MFP subunit